MGRRDRTRRPARQLAFREPKPVVLVVTEGKATEPDYLKGFANALRNPRVKIKVVGGAGVPKTIVDLAKDEKEANERRANRARDENIRYDEVWCVFDVDQHPRIPDAKQMARDNGIEVAISNPCIELWLLLHFAEQPGMQDRRRMRKILKQHVPDYDKHVDYARYAGGYKAAVDRARRLDESARADNDEGRNPTTGVWRLTESIRSGT